MRARVVRWFADKGFGWARLPGPGGGLDVFVHGSELLDPSVAPSMGDILEFDGAIDSPRGRRAVGWVVIVPPDVSNTEQTEETDGDN